jgi:1-acyl-sn-glycerol-3-phosphate acyltransferase
MTITGTEKMMRKHSAAVYPGVARIEFLPAIDPAAYATREELMRAARLEIIDALPEEMRPAR